MLILRVENVTVSLLPVSEKTALLPCWQSEKNSKLPSRCARAAAWELLEDFYQTKGLENPSSAASLREMKTDHGKPFLPVLPEFFFSLTHSEPFAAAAAANGSVGIDLERIRSFSPAVAARCFTAEEQDRLAAAPDPDSLFTLFWTKKEAAAKAAGCGLFGVDTTDFSYFSIPYPKGYWLTVAMARSDR